MVFLLVFGRDGVWTAWMALLVFFLVLALGFSFLCSILEASLLSMPPSFVKTEEAKGTKSGKRLAGLKKNIDRPLSAILSLNTIAHTVGAAGVGAQAAAVFGEGYFGLISAVLTLLILFVSEIIPKTLGAIYWRQLAGFTAISCKAIIVGLLPLVWISEKLTVLVQPKGKRDELVSRDELVALAQLGLSEGVIAESESKIIRNLIRFRKICIEDIMTPRIVVGKLSENLTCGAAIKEMPTELFSRIPVFADDPEHISGYVLKQQILEEVALDRHSCSLADIKRPIRMVSENDSLSDLFRDLFYHKEQIALVVDEYGGMSGVVTNEDLIETLLGLEIVDESDQEEDMRELARRRWKERAKKMGIKLTDPSAE
ncbi:conserved domain protein [Verrucomicrobiia bacterium DG1235]|nr:conserved domain protein [Verrucomicrobiae bacterium DG1235]